MAGCALCGLGVSLMWPGTLSLTAERYPAGGTAMFGALAVFGDVGAAAGPWLSGWVSELVAGSSSLPGADEAGLRAGLLAGVLFPALMLAALLVRKRAKRAKPAESV
jgi:MFS family permease